MNEPVVIAAVIGGAGVVAAGLISLIIALVGVRASRVTSLEQRMEKTEGRLMARIESLTHWGIWAAGDPPRQPPVWEDKP